MRRPARRADIWSGSPPRNIRRQLNSADTMRRPTRGVMERTTVSTSGSSGTSGGLQENAAVFHLHIELLELAGRVPRIFAGGAVEFPHVVRADQLSIVDLSLPE